MSGCRRPISIMWQADSMHIRQIDQHKGAARSKYILLPLVFMLALASAPAYAHHRHHSRRHDVAQPVRQEPLDLTPVNVEPYAVSTEADPKLKAWKMRMHLEDGVMVKGTRYIMDKDVTTRELFVLRITQSLEGGFDSVNIYDRGILSWGIMQWASHSGRLDQALLYIKNRLQEEHREVLWHKLFTGNGLDVDKDAGLEFYGRAPGLNLDARRVLIRGTARPGKYDPATAEHWAAVLARAGRQPEIARLEVEYASKMVDGVLGAGVAGVPYHLPGRSGVTVDDLVSDDPYAAALVFVLWTNNPRHAWQYVAAAANAARSVSAADDPSNWRPGAFASALLGLCKRSQFGNWQQRAEYIEARATEARTAAPADLTPFEQQYQQILAARTAHRLVELASRHMSYHRGESRNGMPLASAKSAASANGRKWAPVDGLRKAKARPVSDGRSRIPETSDGPAH